MSPFNRIPCPYCTRTYDKRRAWALENHIRNKHGEEAFANYRAQVEPASSEAPHRPECSCGRKHAPLTEAQKARLPEVVLDAIDRNNVTLLDAERGLSDYNGMREKAKKWDALVVLLPIIESFLKLTQETEPKRANIQGAADVQD